MPDIIVYFGPLEFAALVLGLVGLVAGAAFLQRQRQRAREQRRLLDSLPYPALLFRNEKLAAHNPAAAGWGESLDLRALVADSLRQGNHIVRTIPAVEGQAYQARAIRLSNAETLLLLEDLAAAQRQQVFYRNFIQNVSHELKTPLTVIQGHAAKMGDAPDDREGWLASRRIIADEAKRLTQLVDNLLTLARLESPSFQLDLAPVNLAALLEEAILQLSDLAEERKLALSLNIAPGLPRLQGDRARLKQAVLNLLDNAMKYTPPGGSVTVEARTDTDHRQVVCSVQDTGEGIPPDDVPYIFDKLYRARRAKGRPVEGSGLGLTIVQQIIRAHGGDITVRSELGKGSAFIFNVPVNA
jgi:two-component system phosphate regulon sensor histidine kinase PhoR